MSSFKRIRKYLIPTLLIVILAVSILASYASYSSRNQSKANPNVYVGVAFGGNTTEEAKVLIDKVKSYTNLFILDSGRNAISENQTSVEEICDYAVSQGLSVIINLGIRDVLDTNRSWFWQHPLNVTKQLWTERWGGKFLGIYFNDEPGGIQLDGNWSAWFRTYGEEYLQHNSTVTNDLNQIYLNMLAYMNNGTKPQNYNLEANFFVQDILKGDKGLDQLNTAGITTYTSDYGLYWFDYLGGYDVLFTELGWNCSVAEQIALVKGAARLQDKEWGAIITWKYDSAPYLDTGDQIYNQMLTSYEAGAKYIVVFNYPYVEGNDYGAMTDEQFIALQRFWNDLTQKKFADLSAPEAVLVLPENYGWGMRNPNDTIWGFWPTDDKTQQIAIATSKLLAQYGVSLDIVYDDPAYPIANVGYKNVYYWNSTDI
jgi:hypothetical protein